MHDPVRHNQYHKPIHLHLPATHFDEPVVRKPIVNDWQHHQGSFVIFLSVLLSFYAAVQFPIPVIAVH